MTTLPQILWSDLDADPDGNGLACPCDTPTVGLPYRLAAFLLAEGLQHFAELEAINAGDSWVWGIQPGQLGIVVQGRRSQFELQPAIQVGQISSSIRADEVILLRLRPQSESTLPNHSAFWIPYTSNVAPPTEFMIVWQHLLQFITAIDGTERMLDQLCETSPSAVPFEERWSTRSRLPMPPIMWQWIEEICRVARTGEFESPDVQTLTQDVLNHLTQEFGVQPLILPDEFLAERCDVAFGDSSSPEFPCAVERREMSPHQSPPRVGLERPALAEAMKVRIAQLTTQPHDFWEGFPERFPNLLRRHSQRIFKQVTQAFQSQGDGTSWEFAVFPEVCLPFDGRQRFERLVSETGRGGVVGCLWREIAPAAEPLARGRCSIRYFASEALVAVPLNETERSRPVVRSFLIRKPLPAHAEIALARRLTEIAETTDEPHVWRILPGRRVFRFVHPSWGDFTVAICSDLLDPAPWLSMRGQLLHVFMCSYNQDVSLFDSLTWVRAYENFANLVATNCGESGGSFAWSPRSGENKEVARIRGNGIFVLADVELPVKELFDWQMTGGETAIDQHLRKWRGERAERNAFKAPPPSFPARLETPPT